MERYIAIDNVCAWPNLTLLPDGTIIATIFNQPCHGKWEGNVECWASVDGGRFWSFCGVPAPHEPGTNRMNVAAGLGPNGELIVIASGWSDRPPKGQLPDPNVKPRVLPAWVCRSQDGGRTWTRSGSFPPPPGRPHIIPFGKVVQLADGTLAVSGYSHQGTDGEDRSRAWFMVSRDGGRTWGEHTLIATDQTECDLLPLPDGRIFAVARSTYEGALTLFISSDGGRTWVQDRQLTGAKEHPAHLLLLEPKKILLTYGVRHPGCFGIAARFTDTAGQKWYGPCMLADLDNAHDGGYPSSVLLPDGTIVTAYYASGVAAHQRYHMGVVRWRLEEPYVRNRAPG